MDVVHVSPVTTTEQAGTPFTDSALVCHSVPYGCMCVQLIYCLLDEIVEDLFPEIIQR